MFLRLLGEESDALAFNGTHPFTDVPGWLSPYVAYEGPAPVCAADWGEDAYPAETTTRYAFYTTARHFGRLALRVLGGIA